MITIDNIQKEYGRETAALLLICRVFAETATIEDLREYVIATQLDWERLYHLIKYHKIRPVAVKVLSQLESMPDGIRHALDTQCKKIAIKNLNYLKELVRIHKLLQKEGIKAVPYKGVIFSMRYYGNATIREFTDQDFLIDDYNVLDKVKELFLKEDYEAMYNVPERFKKTLYKNTCEFFFNKYEDGNRKFHVEFHWMSHHPVFNLPRPVTNKKLFEDVLEIDILGERIGILGDTSQILTVCIHHGTTENWQLLKYILDMAQLMKHADKKEWEKALQISTELSFTRAIHTGVKIANELLGLDVDINYTKQDISANINNVLTPAYAPRPLLSQLSDRLKFIDSYYGKIKLVSNYLRYMFTPSFMDYQFIALPKFFYPLYFFIKPVRQLKLFLKERKLLKSEKISFP